MFDLLICSATVFGGGGARWKVEANGLALIPGIVDVHTHYDAQINWDRALFPFTVPGRPA